MTQRAAALRLCRSLMSLRGAHRRKAIYSAANAQLGGMNRLESRAARNSEVVRIIGQRRYLKKLDEQSQRDVGDDDKAHFGGAPCRKGPPVQMRHLRIRIISQYYIAFSLCICYNISEVSVLVLSRASCS